MEELILQFITDKFGEYTTREYLDRHNQKQFVMVRGQIVIGAHIPDTNRFAYVQQVENALAGFFCLDEKDCKKYVMKWIKLKFGLEVTDAIAAYSDL